MGFQIAPARSPDFQTNRQRAGHAYQADTATSELGQKARFAAGDRTIRDDMAPGASFRLYMLERLRRRTRIRIAVEVLFICVSLVYLTWRATVFNPDAPIFSLVFYLSEVLGFVLATSIISISWRYRYRQFVPAPHGLKVDVFIPTYNENAEMVRRTALAAVRIRYPHETWLLDDGNRTAIKAIADELGCHYIARAKNTDAKPGNLNNALKYATGDFVAILDADFVAQINILDRMLGYFSDPLVSFVQCPQSYYNITAYQYRSENHDRYLWHDEGPFYDVLQPGRDYWNAASSCGTSVVYRRSAIEKIGGFATETVTEDMHTAIRLHKSGYKSVYHPEPLAFGVAPNDLAEYYKTRHRWGKGNVQGLRCERVPFCAGLTLMQRICYLQFGLMYLEGWQRLILYLVPPFILMTGLYPVRATPMFFWFFVPYIVLGYLCFEETMRGYARVYLNEQLCMSRFPIYILSTFAFFSDYARWQVSSKKIIGDLEIYLLSPQIAVLLLNVVALGFGINTIVTEKYPIVPAWITAFVCVFAAIYAWLAILVIKEAIKRAKYKRPDFRFDIPLPVKIKNGPGLPQYGVVSSISTGGMTVIMPTHVVLEPSAAVQGSVYLPNGPVSFTAVMEQAEDVIRTCGMSLSPGENALLFRWQSQTDKDRLDLVLHACGWHRRFVYPVGYLTTPIEWIQQKLLGQSLPMPREKWKYVLYRYARDAHKRFRLGILMIAGGTEQSNSLVAFEAVPVGSHLIVFDPSVVGSSERKVLIVACSLPHDPSEVDIEDTTMTNCNFVPDHDVDFTNVKAFVTTKAFA